MIIVTVELIYTPKEFTKISRFLGNLDLGIKEIIKRMILEIRYKDGFTNTNQETLEKVIKLRLEEAKHEFHSLNIVNVRED
jgi:hypothetical protein